MAQVGEKSEKNAQKKLGVRHLEVGEKLKRATAEPHKL